MGNREALLSGAKQCLYEQGYARTTARDVAAAAGVSLAAIGYHFRSLEALLTAAMIEALGEWGDELARIMPAGNGGDPLEQLEATWTGVIASLSTHRRLWVASHEAFLQAEHTPELRAQLAAGQEHARRSLAATLLRVAEEAVGEATARTVGSFLLALLSGMIVQWLVDPERAPSGRDLADALRTIAAAVGPGDERGSAGA